LSTSVNDVRATLRTIAETRISVGAKPKKSKKPRNWDSKYPGTARFSACELWRWELTRDLNGSHHRPLVSIGLNPSTATAQKDDPTIAKEIKFALRWGCSRYIKVNAYGWRETLPKALFAAQKRGIDIVGADNNDAIRAAIAESQAQDGVLLGAWGGNIEVERQCALARLFEEMQAVVWCIKRNDDGSAKHPLYCRDDSQLIRWSLQGAA